MKTEDEVPSVNPKLDAMCEMLKIIHDFDEKNKSLEKQLTKAKEIIKELLDFDFLPDVKIKKRAEQFLKE